MRLSPYFCFKLSLYVCINTACTVLPSLVHSDQTAVTTDPTATETPFHPIRCSEGEYVAFSLDPQKASSEDFGFAPSSSKVIMLPNLGSTLPAGSTYNVQIDLCYVNEGPVLKRLSMVLPRLRKTGGFLFPEGINIETAVLGASAGAVTFVSADSWPYTLVPAGRVQSTGLDAALSGDADELNIEIPLTGLSRLHVKGAKSESGWVTGVYIDQGNASSRLVSPYILTGRLVVGTKFEAMSKCPWGFLPGVEAYKIGTAKLQAEGCHRSSHTSGSNHDYSWHHVTFQDDNTRLPEPERAVQLLEGDELSSRVNLNVAHHNFTDTVVIRMPSAVYACYLGSLSDPRSGEFPDDVPKDRLETDKNRPCLVKYGASDWEHAAMVDDE